MLSKKDKPVELFQIKGVRVLTDGTQMIVTDGTRRQTLKDTPENRDFIIEELKASADAESLESRPVKATEEMPEEPWEAEDEWWDKK